MVGTHGQEYTLESMAEKQNILLIKNMVCDRCIMSVENIFHTLNIPYSKISLGEINLEEKLNDTCIKNIETALRKIGFELIDTRANKIVEDIKQTAVEYLTLVWTVRISTFLLLLQIKFLTIIVISVISFLQSKEKLLNSFLFYKE